MPELIDRQAALRLCKDADWEDDRIFISGYNHAIRTMTQAITELPTIEAEPVRHGRWIPDHNGIIVCTSCRYPRQIGAKDFCGKCGARMTDTNDGGKGGADNG